MSASCQSIDSMFEVRPIGTRTKFKSVKKPASEIPSVELVTELVEVELEELRFYIMVSVQYAPLGVADDNVYPWQDFPDTPFVVRNDGMMGGCHPVLFKGGIAAEPVRGHIGIPVRTLLNLARNGGSLEIVDDLHLYMPDTLGRTVLIGRRRLGQTAFRHDKDRGLALASPSAFQRAIFLFFGRSRGEEALVNLHIPMEGVASVTLAHHVAQLMHHLPYGLVTLAANLALYLLGGYGTLCRRQKEHGSKPVTNRQMAALHHRTGTKLHLMFAIHARPGLVARIPAQAQTAALTTVQAVMLTETTKGFLTGCLVGILTVKIKQVHNAYVYCLTFYILHKVFQNMPVGQFGSLNFAILVTCGHSFKSLKEVLGKLEDSKHICIFFNVTDGIQQLIENLGISDYKIFCSQKSVNKLLERGIQKAYSQITYPFSKYNFFTCRFYSGLDIILGKHKPDIIILTDFNSANWTMIDPFTEAIQIQGRFRKTTEDEAYNSLTHISTIRPDMKVRSDEELKKRINQIIRNYNLFKEEHDREIDEINKEVIFEEMQDLKYQDLLDEKGEINPFSIDNLHNEEWVKSLLSLCTISLSGLFRNRILQCFLIRCNKNCWR